MLRLAALLLLLVNLLLLGLHTGLLQGLTGRTTGAGLREPERLARQVNPTAVRLLPAPGASAADAAPPAPAGANATGAASAASATGAASAASAAGAEGPASTAARAAACLEAGPFDSTALAGAERSLQQAGLPAGSWLTGTAPPATAYLVYMGPYPDAAGVVRKRDELRQLAIPAYPVDADSGLQPGLSLGRHASAAAAEAAMAGLSRRGVRTARVVTVAATTPAGSLLRVPAADAAQQARLTGLALPGGQAFRACADAAVLPMLPMLPAASTAASAAAPR